MDLQNLQRQRIKLYKGYLKQQIDQKAKAKKQQNSYNRKKQQKNINQLIDKLNEDNVRRVQQRKNMALLLQEHNNQISTLRKSGVIQANSDNQEIMGNNSFMDLINKQQIQRVNRNKQVYVSFTHQNQKQQQMRKYMQERVKSIDKLEEQKHVKRQKEIDIERQRNYQQIKKRHGQNMKIYDMHSQLMNQNQQYRRLTEKFTQCEQDIISKLKRNQSEQRKRRNKSNQQVLKNQMGEYYQRKSLQKSQIMQGSKMQDGIFKNLLHGSPNNKKQYSEHLRYQMSQMQTKKVTQKQGLKQKYRINGIFGGEPGRERQAQIQYVDRRLGLISKPSPLQNINNEEQYQPRSKQLEQPSTATISTNYQNSIQRSPTIQNNNKSSYARPILKNMRQQPVLNLPITTQSPTNSQDKPKYSQQVNQRVVMPKQHSFNLNEPKNNQYVNLRAQNSPDRRMYGSYDFVTGKNRFYI